jgi:hypothetical protein
MNWLDIMIVIVLGLLVITFLFDIMDSDPWIEHVASIGDSRLPGNAWINNNLVIDEQDVVNGQIIGMGSGFYPGNSWSPWWNSTRHTRNMSYDLRGDIPTSYYPVGPWLNSGLV